MGGVTVRRVRAGDAWGVRRLSIERLLSCPAGTWSPLLEDAPQRPGRVWRALAVEHASSPAVVTFVAAAPRLVGCATVTVDHGRAVLGGMYVTPEHRGSGVAKRLLGECLGWSDLPFALWVRPGNPAALGLYGSAGFVLSGRVWEPDVPGSWVEMHRPAVPVERVA